jgi:hypothetical protein
MPINCVGKLFVMFSPFRILYKGNSNISLMIYSLLICLSLVSARAGAQELGTRWIVKKDAWSTSDEKNYSDFITTLGASGCNTVDRCLKSPANPYRKSDPSGAFFDADCGKFPYLLRGYFAWKNGLPFSYANGVRSADGRGNDIRYSPNGNVITSRRTLVPRSAGAEINGYQALKRMQGEVDTAMYRIHPLRDGVDKGSFTDFYMVRIDREAVRPGTIIYDADGHVVVVYKVETDGRVRYFDAHPDKTVSHGVFGEKFARSRPGSGAGFKNFRSLYLLGANKDAVGGMYGGTVTTTPLAKTPGFSLEQFFGNELRPPYADAEWTRARYSANGQEKQWFDFVRAKLAIGELKYHPVEELQNAMDSLCSDLRDRVMAVQTAVDTGIQNRAHPARLPSNIYGTDGDWEEYSSPSRDARLKTSFKEIRDRVEQMVDLFKRGDASVVYTGSDIKGDLLRAYDVAASACVVQYKSSSGQMISLDYAAVVSRLFSISFDPYNCIELRWGASSSQELAACRDTSEKLGWYQAEQRLRNQIDRPYDAVMGFSLHDLMASVRNSGVNEPPDVDLRGYLAR